MPYSRNLGTVLLGLALVFGGDGPGAPSAVADETTVPAIQVAAPDLTGVWNLDAKASDDLKAFAGKLSSLLPADGPQGTGGPGGGMGGPGGGMGGPPGGQGGSGGGMGGRMPADELGSSAEGPSTPPRGGQGPGRDLGANLARAAQQLLVSADGAAIEIVDGAERTETWVPDGESRAQAGPGGRGETRRAVWQEGVLILEQLGGPLAMTRRMRLSDDGRRLLVDISVLDADGKPLTAHLEYAGVE